MKNKAHILLEKHLEELGIAFVREERFHPKRKWRFDYAFDNGWPVAIEIEGAIFSRGRHTRGAGYQKDLEKYNTATAMGWRVYRFSTQDVLNGKARAFLEEHVCK
jgi:hypothetical protein